MARVTDTEVKAIINTTLDTTPFITIANLIVTNVLASATSPSLGSDELKEIERWLAAHFTDIRDPIGLRIKIGPAEQWSFPASVTTAWGMGLRLTPYGQMALAADRTGLLGRMGQQKASYRAAPREDSDSYTKNLTKA